MFLEDKPKSKENSKRTQEKHESGSLVYETKEGGRTPMESIRLSYV